MSQLLLLSGGIDSAAVAAWVRPDFALTIDYGQVCAAAEIRSSRLVSDRLGIEHRVERVDVSAFGSGLLHSGPDRDEPCAPEPDSPSASPSAEFWPFRNQILVSIGAAAAYQLGGTSVILGLVATDRSRHVDGSPVFLERISELCSMQEGGIEVSAPAADMTSMELVRVSGVTMGVLGWTHSCHTGNVACGRCPGCLKRSDVFELCGHPR